MRRLRYPLLLVLLTLLGGAIRFTSLDKPTIWYDEAATFGRTSGSYRQMLGALEDAGFAPLHYFATWWLRNGLPYWGHLRPTDALEENFDRPFHSPSNAPPNAKAANATQLDWVPAKRIIADGVILKPFYLRLIPALCGTLMIPAMYWLARELIGRRKIALLVALLTTFSAYLLNFSRDAKMYSDLWLMVALNVAALLWWLRARTIVSWMIWIVTGTIMVGLQLQGLMIIAIELLIVLTARRQYWRSLAAVLVAPPLMIVDGAVRLFTGGRSLLTPLPVPGERMGEGSSADSTIGEDGRPHPASPQIQEEVFVPSRFTSFGHQLWATIKDWRTWLEALVVIAIILTLTHFRDFLHLRRGMIAIVLIASILIVVGTLVGQLGRPRGFASHRSLFSSFKFPPLLAYLLGVAMISAGPAVYFTTFNQFGKNIEEEGFNSAGLQWVPEYNLGRTGPELLRYTASAFLTGWEWPREDVWRIHLKDSRDMLARLRELSTSSIEVTPLPAEQTRPRDRRVNASQPSRDDPFIVPTDQITSRIKRTNDFDLIDPRTLRLKIGGTIALAAILLLGAFPWRWPWRKDAIYHMQPMRFRTIVWIAVWIALPVYGLYLTSITNHATPSDWFHRAGELWREHGWVKVAAPTIAILAILVCDLTWQRRLRRAAQFALAIAIVTGLCSIVRMYLEYRLSHADENWSKHGSIWIPRYIGIILPALLIVVACLIARLPTKLLRGVAIALFVIVNSAQFIERVDGSEPPVDRMVADALAGPLSSSTQWLFYGANRGGPEPGHGALFIAPARYYYAVDERLKQVDPQEIRGWQSPIDLKLLSERATISSAGQIAEALKKAPPTLKRIVVWDRLAPRAVDLTDKTADAIGPAWQRESDERFIARDHWTWREYNQFRRRVYVKADAAPSSATTAPAVGG